MTEPNLEPITRELRRRAAALRARRRLGDLLLASNIEDVEARLRELLRSRADVAVAPASRTPLDTQERLAREAHDRVWEPMNPSDYKGHDRLRFEDCPHPDCVLVRSASPLVQVRASGAQEKK